MLMIHDDYLTYESEYIKENKPHIIEALTDGINFFNRIKHKNEMHKDRQHSRQFDITWDYWKYNIFSLTAGNEYMHNVFLEIRYAFSKYLENFNLQENRPWWFESWVNCHEDNQILTKHSHQFEIHGYVSIEPLNTRTCFQNWNNDRYHIDNVTGMIYIGPGMRDHWVEKTSEEKFPSKRFSLGVDFLSYLKSELLDNMSFIPIDVK